LGGRKFAALVTSNLVLGVEAVLVSPEKVLYVLNFLIVSGQQLYEMTWSFNQMRRIRSSQGLDDQLKKSTRHTTVHLRLR
jgi:hypothetical protein